MLIKRLEIQRFRSIRQETVDFGDLTIFVGRNGAGKSSILWAIEYFYDVGAPVTEEDFFDKKTVDPIQLRVTFGTLSVKEKEEFSAYLDGEELVVTKRFEAKNGKIDQRYFGATKQISDFAEIRNLSTFNEKRTRLRELAESNRFPGLRASVRGANELDRVMEEYERSHPELLIPCERSEQFFGPKNIGGGKLDKYTKYVLVPAVRDAIDEAVDRKGAIHRILETIVLRKVSAREDVKNLKAEFEDKVKEVYSSENLTELRELGETISRTLGIFSPGAELRLNWDEVQPPEVQLPSSRVTLVEDAFEGEISRKGHGLQRALIITLLQHLAVVLPEHVAEEDADGQQDSSQSTNSASSSGFGPDLILAIEEPELYLHPSRCRYLAKILLDLTDNPSKGLGYRNQVLYCTHSPYFVELHMFDYIRKVRKSACNDTEVRRCTVSRYSLNAAAEELAKVNNADPSIFTRDSFLARSLPVMNAIVNEGFFADVVVVVEGQGDVGVLWSLQEMLKLQWDQRSIVVVSAGAKNNIDRPVVIFKGLSVPTYFMFDGDAHKRDASDADQARKQNHVLLRLAGVPVQDWPKTQVCENWAVLHEELERQFKCDLGDELFATLCSSVSNKLGYDRPSKVLKNVQGASFFVKEVYSQGQKLETFERIVRVITQMHDKLS